MSYATIRDAIKAAIEAVAGISGGDGTVVDHEPENITRQNYIDNFANAAQTKINGWTIDFERTRTVQQDPGFRFQRVRDVLVRARYGLQESGDSKKAFTDLIDAVETALLGSVSVWVEHPEDEQQAIQTEIIDQEMHGPFLVHYAEMRFSVEEFDVISS